MESFIKFLIFSLLFFLIFGSFGEASKTQSPTITFQAPKEIPSQGEFKIHISISQPESKQYDIKISIEKDRVLSEIFNPMTEKWQSSLYYIKEMIAGTDFVNDFRLRIKKDFSTFEGDAQLKIRLRESGRGTFYEKKDSIKIYKVNKSPDTKSANLSARNLDFEGSIEWPSQYRILSLGCAIFSGLLLAIVSWRKKNK